MLLQSQPNTPFIYFQKLQTAQAGLPIDCLSIPNALPIDCQWDANGLALSGSTCQDHIIAIPAHYMDFALSAPFYSLAKPFPAGVPMWFSECRHFTMYYIDW